MIGLKIAATCMVIYILSAFIESGTSNDRISQYAYVARFISLMGTGIGIITALWTM